MFGLGRQPLVAFAHARDCDQRRGQYQRKSENDGFHAHVNCLCTAHPASWAGTIINSTSERGLWITELKRALGGREPLQKGTERRGNRVWPLHGQKVTGARDSIHMGLAQSATGQPRQDRWKRRAPRTRDNPDRANHFR